MKGLTTVKRGASWPAPAAFGRLCGEAVVSALRSRANKSPDQGGRRLRPDRPAHTIRAECHGNIQFHYELDRRISIREAARLQSFPDSHVRASLGGRRVLPPADE